jgi:hypothetical protein
MGVKSPELLKRNFLDRKERLQEAPFMALKNSFLSEDL